MDTMREENGGILGNIWEWGKIDPEGWIIPEVNILLDDLWQHSKAGNEQSEDKVMEIQGEDTLRGNEQTFVTYRMMASGPTYTELDFQRVRKD